MTIVAVVSGPRKDGFSRGIAERIVAGAESVGKEVKVYCLHNLVPVSDCRNCGGCKENGGRCVLNDPLTPVLEGIRDAEGIIQVATVNFNHVDGLFKTYFDRLYCFLDASASSVLPKGKKIATAVVSGADESAAENECAEYEKIMVQHFFCESVGRLCYTSWLLPPGQWADESILDRAEELGRNFR